MSKEKCLEYSEILGLPREFENLLEIVDRDGPLHMVSLKEPSDALYEIRGVVVDYEKRVIVCPSLGYDRIIRVENHLKEIDGKLIIPMNDNSLSFSQYELFVGYEGALLRVYKYEGNVYISSYKAINCQKAKWGRGFSFLSLFLQYLKRDPESLFGKEKTYRHFYSFLLTHPSLRLSSSFSYNGLILLNSEKTPLPFPPGETIQYSLPVSISIANQCLFPQNEGIDPRLSGGDFLMLRSDQGTFRLESPAYQFRVKMTGGDPNMYNHFVFMMEKIYRSKEDVLLRDYPHYEISLKTGMGRQIFWWSLYCDVIQPSAKQEVEGYYHRYRRDIAALAKKIIGKERIAEMPEWMRRRFDNLRNIAEKGKYSLHRNLVNLLYKEHGKNITRMLRYYHFIEK